MASSFFALETSSQQLKLIDLIVKRRLYATLNGNALATTALMSSVVIGSSAFTPILEFIVQLKGTGGYLIVLARLLGLSATFFSGSYKYFSGQYDPTDNSYEFGALTNRATASSPQ